MPDMNRTDIQRTAMAAALLLNDKLTPLDCTSDTLDIAKAIKLWLESDVHLTQSLTEVVQSEIAIAKELAIIEKGQSS